MQRNASEAQHTVDEAWRYLIPVTYADAHGGAKNRCVLASKCPMSDEPDCGGCCPAAETGLLVWAPCEVDKEAYETRDRYFVDEDGCFDGDAFTYEDQDRLAEGDDEENLTDLNETLLGDHHDQSL